MGEMWYVVSERSQWDQKDIHFQNEGNFLRGKPAWREQLFQLIMPLETHNNSFSHNESATAAKC